MSKKKYYSPEFKQEAVRLAEASGNKSQRGRPAVARDLGIHATVIGKWQRELQEGGKKAFSDSGKPRNEEMVHLKKENRRLQQEVEILKKAVGGSRAVSSASAPRKIPIYSGALPPWRGQEFSITVMSEVLQVSRSGYYAWLKRPHSNRSTQNEQLVKQIKDIHQQSRQTYGSPRVHDELRDMGVACSENRVARLMQQYGIAAPGARSKRKESLPEQRTLITSYLLRPIYSNNVLKWIDLIGSGRLISRIFGPKKGGCTWPLYRAPGARFVFSPNCGLVNGPDSGTYVSDSGRRL